jgi:hypothetical protein
MIGIRAAAGHRVHSGKSGGLSRTVQPGLFPAPGNFFQSAGKLTGAGRVLLCILPTIARFLQQKPRWHTACSSSSSSKRQNPYKTQTVTWGARHGNSN